jgi:hypothetical protein
MSRMEQQDNALSPPQKMASRGHNQTAMMLLAGFLVFGWIAWVLLLAGISAVTAQLMKVCVCPLFSPVF